MTEQTAAANTNAEPTQQPKKKRGGRKKDPDRGTGGLIELTDGAELLQLAIRGQITVRRARRVGWIAKRVGAEKRFLGRVRMRKARLSLAQALALEALFPWIPAASWLTARERAMVQAARTVGLQIAAEPPPNPKTNRRKLAADPRQVTIDDILKDKASAAAPPPSAAPDEDLPDFLDDPAGKDAFDGCDL